MWPGRRRFSIIRPMCCSGTGSTGTAPRLRFDRGTLLLDGIDGEQVRNLFTPYLWTWDGRVGAWRCDAIHYAAVCDALAERLGAAWRNEVPEPPPVH